MYNNNIILSNGRQYRQDKSHFSENSKNIFRNNHRKVLVVWCPCNSRFEFFVANTNKISKLRNKVGWGVGYSCMLEWDQKANFLTDSTLYVRNLVHHTRSTEQRLNRVLTIYRSDLDNCTTSEMWPLLLPFQLVPPILIVSGTEWQC